MRGERVFMICAAGLVGRQIFGGSVFDRLWKMWCLLDPTASLAPSEGVRGDRVVAAENRGRRCCDECPSRIRSLPVFEMLRRSGASPVRIDRDEIDAWTPFGVLAMMMPSSRVRATLRDPLANRIRHDERVMRDAGTVH